METKGISKNHEYRIMKIHYSGGYGGESGECYSLQRRFRTSWFVNLFRGEDSWFDWKWSSFEDCNNTMIQLIEADNAPKIKVTRTEI